MLDCRHATLLVSQSMEQRLTLRQRLALRLHLMMCDACTQFRKQLQLLRAAVAQWGHKVEHDDTLALSSQARDRIAQAMIERRQQADEARRHPDHDLND